MGRISLDVGHGFYDETRGTRLDPGAMAAGGAWSEFHANLVAATVAADGLRQLGHEVHIQGFGKSLSMRGEKAAGFDVFLSIHHNAANGVAQGTEAVVGKGIATQADRELAAIVAKTVSETLKLKNRGVIELGLGVLTGARKTNVRAACLSEAFFIDVPGIDVALMARAEGRALAVALDLFLARQSRV